MRVTSETKSGKSSINIHKGNPVYDQKLEIIKNHKLSKADLRWFLKNIYLSRKTDDTEILMKKQNKAQKSIKKI